MTHYDPRDWGKDEPPEGPNWVDTALAALILLLLAAVLVQCSEADAAALPPFDVTLPNGQRVTACAVSYDATAKAFVFGPCDTVFSDSFEGG